MMKKILKVLTMILMVVALTGCMKMNVHVEVKSDKTMKMGMEMLVEETFLETAGMTADEYLDQMKEQVLSKDSLKDAKTTPIDKTIDGTKWVGLNIEGTSTADEAKGLLSEKEIDGKDCIVLTLPMDDFENEMDLDSMNAYGYSVSKLKATGMEMNIIVEMPGEATTNVGKAEGNKVTVDLLELMSTGNVEDLVISSPMSGGGAGTTIALIAAGVAIIAGAVFFILKKKKKPTDEYVESTSTPEGTEAQETQTYCPNCGEVINSEETCPKCGYTIKK